MLCKGFRGIIRNFFFSDMFQADRFSAKLIKIILAAIFAECQSVPIGFCSM
jgi:hypothetical protein